MSAVVCGKRSLFEDLSVSSPPVSKRIRFSSSPVRFSPARSISNRSYLIEYLLTAFPSMEKQIIEKTLEECGDDMDSAIRSLNELHLGYAGRNWDSVAGKPETCQEASEQLLGQGAVTTNGEVPLGEEPLAASQLLPGGGEEWVELFVREMMSATNIDDARARASRALEAMEKSIRSNVESEAAHSFHQEHTMLKEQLETLLHENAILKRAVAIQHERQKESVDKSHELLQLKQQVSQYQEQLRTLEINNYALTMHLRQAQQSNSIPGRFHPDVF